MQEVDQERENQQSEIATALSNMDAITVGEYIEIDPAVKRIMHDTKENNYW